jgi:AraC-like DNA-binding protein
MFGSRTFTFTDPYPYQAAIRGAELEVIVTTAGDFRAELTQIDLPRLRLSRARLEEFLAANLDQPLYLAEICAATGASDHTLRSCCQEYLGMSAIHYLWLRRMHMTHRALVRASSATTTVTEIATNCGLWELGRFSVEYRALFGEAPSVSLRRPPDDWPIASRSQGRKSARVDRPPGRSSRVSSIYSSTASPKRHDTAARHGT